MSEFDAARRACQKKQCLVQSRNSCVKGSSSCMWSFYTLPCCHSNRSLLAAGRVHFTGGQTLPRRSARKIVRNCYFRFALGLHYGCIFHMVAISAKSHCINQYLVSLLQFTGACAFADACSERHVCSHACVMVVAQMRDTGVGTLRGAHHNSIR